MQKTKRSLALYSLFALLLLVLLACNGFRIFVSSFQHPFLPSPSETLLLSKSSSSMHMYSLKEDIPTSKSKTHIDFVPSIRPHWNSSSKPPKNNKWVFKLLRPNERSRRFSEKAQEFFNGSSPKCQVRFFMTWISPLESFGEREFFTVESLFKSHPKACLFIVSDSLDSPAGARLLAPLVSLGFRVSAASPDFAYLFKSTVAEAWFDRLRQGKVDPGEVSLAQNLSNLLRLAILYKFGGVYIDSDVIVTKSFSKLRNTIGAQTIDAQTGNWSRLNNAVMIFDKKHPLLYKFIEEFALTFDGNKWGHNGPYLVSRVVERVSGRPGFDFTVLPPPAFYPVDWTRISGFFEGPGEGSHSRWVEAKLEKIRKESFAVHLWNRQSRNIVVEDGSVIARMMSECCIFCNSSMSAL
ncbi:hypothetical protein QJS04_geneDACA000516 [Acorus gramineus]|uniref:Alpha 1,4-glycosyltransferase domain-containing protein n=1 Tax=Acorus gramineus TaxID=55184 RepID=A0AAV9AQU1_ACOGR|nr:hypothetical protein QJS04_geneDACA000516 [Acorus gramineus]